jgi:2'-5' RNA ligase
MRCFIALALPGEVKAKLEAVQAAMRETLPEARWTKGEGHHITLAFLGDLNSGGLDCAFHAAKSLSGFGSLPLRFSGLIGFPPRSPHRVLAMSLVDIGPEEMGKAEGSRLRGAYVKLNESLRSFELRHGIPPLNEDYPSGRPFHPHVTLARCEMEEIDKRLMRALGEFQAPLLEESFRISQCVVYESRLSASGAEYHPLLQVDMDSAPGTPHARG